jgi:hypothetical protein
MEAPSSVFSRFRLCVRLVCLPWFCFSSLVPSHPLYFLVFSFVPPCSLFLSSSLLALLFLIIPPYSFFVQKNPPYSKRMPCGYPDNKELIGLLLQKFEILQKVTLCMCNNTGRAFNTSITAVARQKIRAASAGDLSLLCFDWFVGVAT